MRVKTIIFYFVCVLLLGYWSSLLAGEQIPKSLIIGKVVYYPDEALYYKESKKTAFVTKFETPPVIDGKIDDSCWTQAKEYGDFVLVTSEGLNQPAKKKTFFRAGYDEDNLYLGIILEEPDMSSLKVSPKPELDKRDSAIEDQDVVNIMLSAPTARQLYFNICVNAAGEIADTGMKWKSGEVSWYYRGYDIANLVVKTSRQESRWTVEMVVPYAGVMMWASENSAPWAFQIVRQERTQNEFSSWNRCNNFPEGPWSFGILWVKENEEPLILERADVIKVGSGEYILKCIIRKLAKQPVSAEILASVGGEGKIKAVFKQEITTIFFPYKIDESKLNFSPGCNESDGIRGILFAQIEGKEMINLGTYGVQIPKIDTPGKGWFSLQKGSILQGEKALKIKFSLPVGDDLISNLEMKVNIKNTAAEEKVELKGREGEFALATDFLPCGEHTIVIEVSRDDICLFSRSFKLTVLEGLL
ncbi:MAG: hypothetical protein V2A65_10450 [Candidatus Omnitrophota bacterium]